MCGSLATTKARHVILTKSVMAEQLTRSHTRDNPSLSSANGVCGVGVTLVIAAMSTTAMSVVVWLMPSHCIHGR